MYAENMRPGFNGGNGTLRKACLNKDDANTQGAYSQLWLCLQSKNVVAIREAPRVLGIVCYFLRTSVLASLLEEGVQVCL
jgi:hypothetical protein